MNAEPLTLKVKLLHPNAVLPAKAFPGDAGFDCVAVEATSVWPGEVARLSLGFAAELPPGWSAVLRGRSSLGARGIAVLAGLIDGRFRGEWAAVVANAGRSVWPVKPGDRVVQFTLHAVPVVSVVEAAELGETERGTGGFGSSDRRNPFRCPTCLIEIHTPSGEPFYCPACGCLTPGKP